MKILNLKIFNNKNEKIRSIDFDESGVSYIFGNIEKPQDKTKTNNSIGKTLLLKFINYIYGANEFSQEEVLKNLNNFRIEAVVKYDGKFYDVKRTINDKVIYINKTPYKLKDYHQFFNLERSLLAKQIALESRKSIISLIPNATDADYKAILTLLKLKEICDIVTRIFNLQENLNSNKSKYSYYISVLKLNEKEIDKDLNENSKNIEILNTKIDSIKNEIKNLKITSENLSIQDEYNAVNNKIKQLKFNYAALNHEKESLEKYIEDSEKSTLTSSDVEKIYKSAKIEIPELVKKQLKEVDEFYKQISFEHIEKSKARIVTIEESFKQFNNEIASLTNRLDELSDVLASNDAYKNALEILYSYNKQLHDETFKKGQLEQLDLLKKEKDTLEQELVKNKQLLDEQLKKEYDIINTYKKFVYDIIYDIYEKSVNVIFDIGINKNKRNKTPIKISMSITGDLGEGKKEVEKNVMDYLIFNYNDSLNILIQDSCCYNGIDPRQIESLLRHLERIATTKNKQAFVSINSSQLEKTFSTEISNKAKIILSENNKLLMFDF